MKKLNLVTGGTGLLGSYLIKNLIKNEEQVRAIKRPDSRLDLLGSCKDQVEWIDADLMDVIALDDAMNGVNQVYHCAAMISFNPKKANEMYEINVEGTANIVNAGLENKINKMLCVSSVAAIGRTGSEKKITEKTEWNNSKFNSNYSKSKFMAEKEAWRGWAEGMPTVIINPSTILGAGYWNTGTGRMFSTVGAGLSFYTPGSNGFVDVRDVVEIMIKLMESDITGERFIVSNENATMKFVLQQMAEHLETKKPYIKTNDLLNRLAIYYEQLKSIFSNEEPLITKETAMIASGNYIYDNSKIKNTVSHDFIPINQTILETSKLYKESKNQGKDFATFY